MQVSLIAAEIFIGKAITRSHSDESTAVYGAVEGKSYFVKPLKKERFEALAGYTRRPESQLVGGELEWYADPTERVIGVFLEDLIDHDFQGIVLGRDARQRFRAVDFTEFAEAPQLARQRLFEKMEEWTRRPESDFHQGDEKGTALDIFTPVVSVDRLHPSFLRVATGEGFSPARSLIEAMMPYYEDVDGNFVEQFQTAAFDARFWELYLFALLTEQGFAFDRSFHAPDFYCERFLDRVFVEAVTVNPTTNAAGIVTEAAVPAEKEAFIKYYQEYMPMKWGSPLTSKLKKKYWEMPHVAGKPIAFAIQDFHIPRAMTFLANSLPPYLYGVSFTALYDEHENLNVTTMARGPHEWGSKTIESGFFSLPDSEHVSAVVTNPTATISKFNRMAFLAGFGGDDVRMICRGTCHDHDPNAAVPRQFAFDINDPDYLESWAEGANVFHNPNASIPLDESFLPDAAHHRFEDGVFRSIIPEFHPYNSETLIVTPERRDEPAKFSQLR